MAIFHFESKKKKTVRFDILHFTFGLLKNIIKIENKFENDPLDDFKTHYILSYTHTHSHSLLLSWKITICVCLCSFLFSLVISFV